MFDELNDIKCHLMVIDDSQVVLRVIRKVLEEEYSVSTAASCEEAMPMMHMQKPDLILLDVIMPNHSGFDTIKLIKDDSFLADIPVIFLTGKNDIEFELEAFKLGAVDYINKPFANPLLLKRVELHLYFARQKRSLQNYNQNLERMVSEKTEIIKELQYAIVFTLADLVEMRDVSTGGHVLRTQSYFKLMLDFLEDNHIYQSELAGIETNLLLEASQLHDIGKVAIPDAILLKPARLTVAEFEIMKTHTIIGHQAITKAMKLTRDKEFLNIASIVSLTHHEKWNGTGYPNGLSAYEIPIAGRIMAIVDVYDAIVSERHYKKALNHEQALAILKDGRGQHFDPVLTDVFVEINEEFDKVHNQVF